MTKDDDMRALLLRSHGDPDGFELTDVERPSPGPGTVLIRLSATSINQVDILIRKGLPIGADLPAVLGCDAAGTVEAVGEGVLGFAPGDAVWGCAGGVKGQDGTLAEFMVADARLLARKPERLDMRQAAALPLVALTAWESLERTGVKAGDHVLVHAGAGGVGHVAVQLAKAAGARVSATVGTAEDAEVARGFGADDVINYKEEAVPAYVDRLTAGRGFAAIIDTVGNANLDNSFQAAALNGRIATTGVGDAQDLSGMRLKALRLDVILMLIPMLHDVGRDAHGRIMGHLSTLADAGKLRPLIDPRRFDLARAADAHRHLESGDARGKVVVDVP